MVLMICSGDNFILQLKLLRSDDDDVEDYKEDVLQDRYYMFYT